jgi:DNA polymerase-3 subunit gamma/tau
MALSLAIKYRPQTFDDVVEQGSIKTILQEQLKTNTHKNCYLFTGGAGTGKTTCARIFANEINGRKGNPIEIDAASNNGVENVREIIDNAKFKALDAPYKVYIIDECHMLSTGAWNAMLKLIEEPPAQTLFIFCTTDPQKIPATILSRVQRYDFQRITFASVVDRLKNILAWENEDICESRGNDIQPGDNVLIEYEDEALEYIAKLADGGMRDAITLLDKCISYSQDVTMDNVVQALGTIDYSTMLNLTNAILDMKAAEVVTIIEEAYRAGMDLKQFIKQYSYFVLDLCKYDLLGGFEYLQIPSTLQTELESYADDDFEFLHTLLDSIIKLNADIKWETAPKPLIEATLILLCKGEDEVE